jgi:hypothetical protein
MTLPRRAQRTAHPQGPVCPLPRRALPSRLASARHDRDAFHYCRRERSWLGAGCRCGSSRVSGASVVAACGGRAPERVTAGDGQPTALGRAGEVRCDRTDLRSPDVDGRMDPVSQGGVFVCPSARRVEVSFDPGGTVALVASTGPLARPAVRGARRHAGERPLPPWPSRSPAGSDTRGAGSRWTWSSPRRRYRASPRVRRARHRGRPRSPDRLARKRRRHAVVGRDERPGGRPGLVGVRRQNPAAEERRLPVVGRPGGRCEDADSKPGGECCGQDPISHRFPTIRRSDHNRPVLRRGPRR